MDTGAARAALLDRARAFGELARSAPDPERRVVDSDWTVREVSAHLVLIAEAFCRYGPAPEADCRVSADPVALLSVLYGRRSQWGAIARGKMVAYGRRPWLALGFNDRFTGF